MRVKVLTREGEMKRVLRRGIEGGKKVELTFFSVGVEIKIPANFIIENDVNYTLMLLKVISVNRCPHRHKQARDKVVGSLAQLRR